MMATLLHKRISISGACFLLLFSLFLFATPFLVGAQDFVSLSGLEGINTGGGDGLADTFNTIYIITIAVGAVFAVVKIAVAGVRYMLSDVVTDKAAARKDITGAILGLVIILATYIVLYTIYPGLVDFNILEQASTGGIENLSSVISSESGTPSCRTC